MPLTKVINSIKKHLCLELHIKDNGPSYLRPIEIWHIKNGNKTLFERLSWPSPTSVIAAQSWHLGRSTDVSSILWERELWKRLKVSKPDRGLIKTFGCRWHSIAASLFAVVCWVLSSIDPCHSPSPYIGMSWGYWSARYFRSSLIVFKQIFRPTQRQKQRPLFKGLIIIS